jgi:hypothetical protein
MKLIKINTDHYVIVDDSEIKEGDWVYQPMTNAVYKTSRTDNSDIGYKITHSTQPLGVKPITDKVVIEEDKDGKPLMSAQYVELDMSSTVKPLSLQEVKELISEVDVEKKAMIEYEESRGNGSEYAGGAYSGYINGYNQALADNKDKKYTGQEVFDLMCKAFEQGFKKADVVDAGLESKETDVECAWILKVHGRPKTEWEVEFIDGKLKLK